MELICEGELPPLWLKEVQIHMQKECYLLSLQSIFFVNVNVKMLYPFLQKILIGLGAGIEFRRVLLQKPNK